MFVSQRDEVECSLATVADARAFCLKYHPAFLAWLEQELHWVDEQLPQPAHAEACMDLMLVCFARMALRNGSQSTRPLHYHNENHVLEILHRLHHVVQQVPEQVRDWYLLALFAAAHDLRQQEPRNPERYSGCGINEQASWEELQRLNEDLQSPLEPLNLQTLRWMIEGSTFYMGMQLGTCQGAWAADLVQQEPMQDWQREMVLLAADLDTANVAEGFLELARSSLALARERLLLQPAENADQARDFMRRFLEQVQWHYISRCQQFRSRVGMGLFEPMKQHNLCCLKQFIDRLQAHEPFRDSEELVHWYLNEAQQVAERDCPQ